MREILHEQVCSLVSRKIIAGVTILQISFNLLKESRSREFTL